MHMRIRFLRLTSFIACIAVCGCAAMITGSGTSEHDIIRTGMSEAQLTQGLGPPLRRKPLSEPLDVWGLRERDPQVRLLVYPEYGFDSVRGSYPIPTTDLAATESTYRFIGRVGKDNRAAQPGFDSFMTLGLAEVFLVPKALIEQAQQEGSLLTVWFDTRGRSIAYKWAIEACPSGKAA
jgi:hypothetical protein